MYYARGTEVEARVLLLSTWQTWKRKHLVFRVTRIQAPILIKHNHWGASGICIGMSALLRDSLFHPGTWESRLPVHVDFWRWKIQRKLHISFGISGWVHRLPLYWSCVKLISRVGYCQEFPSRSRDIQKHSKEREICLWRIALRSTGHYVKNISNTELEVLEIFRAPKFEDVSVEQWLGITPKRMVVEHLLRDYKKAAKNFAEEIERKRLRSNQIHTRTRRSWIHNEI